MTYFDANCFLGSAPVFQPGAPAPPDNAAGLLRVMDRHGIAEALVCHAWSLHYHADTGNRELLAQVAAHTRLHPCWVAVPNATAEFLAPSDLIAQMEAAGVAAVRLLPGRCGPIRAPLFGPLLAALADRTILTLIDFELQHYSTHLKLIDWDGLDWLLGKFPALPTALLRVGQGVDRTLFPLLERRRNLHVETSYYLGTGGLERLCARFGPERALFGTGLPQYTPGAAVTLVSYSGLDEAARRLVAGENLRRLLRSGEEKRG